MYFESMSYFEKEYVDLEDEMSVYTAFLSLLFEQPSYLTRHYPYLRYKVGWRGVTLKAYLLLSCSCTKEFLNISV